MKVKAYTAMLGDVKQAASAGHKLWVDPSKASPAYAASLQFCAHVHGEAVRLSLLGTSQGCPRGVGSLLPIASRPMQACH